jgi:multidrug efflux pump subunit AcrB
MRIVRLALAQPYTFIVLAILILLASPVAIDRMPTDIFPNINIPVVAVDWSYTGLSPQEFEGRIVSLYERGLTTTVNDIEHIESQTLNGKSVVKVFFQPSVNTNTAIAQVTALSQSVLSQMPKGITPPLIISYSASTVPILQLSLSSDSLSEQELAVGDSCGRGCSLAVWRQKSADYGGPESCADAGKFCFATECTERTDLAKPYFAGWNRKAGPV